MFEYKRVYYHRNYRTWQASRHGYPALPCDPDQEQVAAAAATVRHEHGLPQVYNASWKPHSETRMLHQYKHIVWHSSRKKIVQGHTQAHRL